MKVINRLNNNVVLVKNGSQKMIVIGKGLGYKVYPNDEINGTLIEQRFVLQESNEMDYYLNMLKNLPFELLSICEAIVSLASNQLDKVLPDNLIFALADHLNFAITRSEQNMSLDHPLANEIKYFYPNEMAISIKALSLIKEKLNINLPKGEAVFITMHIVNAVGGLSDAYDITNLTNAMKNTVLYIEQIFQCKVNQESASFSRFITHLRYYLIRQLNFDFEESINSELLDLVKEKYPKAFTCAEQITKYLDSIYNTNTVDSEKLYLTLHINRLINTN